VGQVEVEGSNAHHEAAVVGALGHRLVDRAIGQPAALDFGPADLLPGSDDFGRQPEGAMPGWMRSIWSQKFLTSVRDASSKDV
jgi:hypothetical protein